MASDNAAQLAYLACVPIADLAPLLAQRTEEQVAESAARLERLAKSTVLRAAATRRSKPRKHAGIVDYVNNRLANGIARNQAHALRLYALDWHIDYTTAKNALSIEKARLLDVVSRSCEPGLSTAGQGQHHGGKQVARRTLQPLGATDEA